MNFNKYIAQIDNNLQFMWNETETNKREVVRLETFWAAGVGPYDAAIRIVRWRHPEVVDELTQHGTINGVLIIQD